MKRREFLKQATVLPAAGPLVAATPEAKAAYHHAKGSLSLHVFSKHLQFLDYQTMAAKVAEIGFDGIDLTVRRGGHVLPERVGDDLPRAVEAIRDAGLLADMMVTNVNNAWDPLHRRVLRTAAAAGIKWYRTEYVDFNDQPIPARLQELNDQMLQLARLNRVLGLHGAYQNHAGTRVGANIWDIWHLLDEIEPEAIGCQYDIRHAVVEGGLSWRNGLALILPKINCLVLKDFVWRPVNGKWQVVNVPLGEGMVDFDAYFKLLKHYDINVPVSIHYEYELGGAEDGARDLPAADRKRVYEAMKKDLEFARTTWENA